jgi:PAS domain S-box-containing protein
LISNCPAALYTCEASGDFGATFVSKTITSQVGYETREFIDDASFWANHIHPEDRDGVLAELSKLSEQGHHTSEYRFLHKDGTYRWMHDRSSLLLGSDGTPEQIVGFWMDVTEQKRAEEVETHLGRIVEESLDEIYIFDAERQYFLLVNRGARENLGYSMEELKTLTPLDLNPDQTSDRFAEINQQLRSGEKELIQYETRHRRKDGSQYDVEVHLQMAKYQGQPVFVAIILDISDRIRLEKARSERALEAELLYQAVVMADEVDSFDAALQKCVDIVCEMTAWPVGHAYVPSANGAQQLEPTKVWYFADRQRFTKLREVTERTPFVMGEGLPGRIWSSGEPAWIAKVQEDGNFPRNKLCKDLGVKAAFGFPVKIRGELVAILEFFNEREVEKNETLLLLVRSVGEQVGRVMERREAEESSRRQHERVAEELEKAKGELILRTRLAAIGQMSAQIAHEMRNPLGAVSNAVYYLKRHVPASEQKWSDYLSLIDSEVAIPPLHSQEC